MALLNFLRVEVFRSYKFLTHTTVLNNFSYPRVLWYDSVFTNEKLIPSIPPWQHPGDEPLVMEKMDDYTVELTLAEPSAIFLPNLTLGGQQLADWKWTPMVINRLGPDGEPLAFTIDHIEMALYGSWFE